MDKKFRTTVIISVLFILGLTIFGIVKTTKLLNSENDKGEIVLYKYKEKGKFETIAD